MRITPACAGKSFFLVVLTPLPEDHPRVCGEKPSASPGRQSAIGSPPRVRGKGGDKAGDADKARITPACAGKRQPPTIASMPLRDHPRVCGEKTKNLPIARFFSLIRNVSQKSHLTSHIADSLSGSPTALCVQLHMVSKNARRALSICSSERRLSCVWRA